MAYAFTNVTADCIEDEHDRIVASVLARHSIYTLLQRVSQDNILLCYISVQLGQFPSVTIFGLEEECTWESCLELSNQTFIALAFQPDKHRIRLFLNSYEQFLPASEFFEEHGYVYEMSFGSYVEHDVLCLKKAETAMPKRRNWLQMLGLKSAA